MKWRSWTSKRAVGSGRNRPCRGRDYKVTVRASRPRGGYFTRLTVRYGSGSTARLALADLSGIGWVQVDWMNDADSGAEPWPS